MKRFPSVKKNGEFQKIYRGGTSHANRLLVMYVMENGEGSNRIGISVSKKVVIFTFIGYSKQEIVVGNQAKINVQLKEDAQNLDEVVVVGYGLELILSVLRL